MNWFTYVLRLQGENNVSESVEEQISKISGEVEIRRPILKSSKGSEFVLYNFLELKISERVGTWKSLTNVIQMLISKFVKILHKSPPRNFDTYWQNLRFFPLAVISFFSFAQLFLAEEGVKGLALSGRTYNFQFVLLSSFLFAYFWGAAGEGRDWLCDRT